MSLLGQVLGEQSLRRLFFSAILGVVVLYAGRAIIGPSYAVTVQFQPRGASRSGLGGLAAQLGVDPTSTTDSPQFYAELLRVADLVAIVARDSVVTDSVGTRSAVAQSLEIEPVDSATRVARTSRRLRGMLTVTSDRRTGIVTFVVTHKSRYIAKGIAASYLQRLQTFDVERRQIRASIERQFVQGRVQSLSESLASAEDSLRDFMKRNRSLNAPELILDRDRLMRVVTLRQSVLVSLSQSFEQAKIEEVRDTPLITILQQPDLPVFPVRRRTIPLLLLGGFLGASLSVGWMSRARLTAAARQWASTAMT